MGLKTLVLNSPFTVFSVRGVSVCTGCLGGRGLADCSGALRDQLRLGRHRGRGGETPEKTRGLREIHRHLGGALFCAGAPHDGVERSKTLKRA